MNFLCIERILRRVVIIDINLEREGEREKIWDFCFLFLNMMVYVKIRIVYYLILRYDVINKCIEVCL